MKKLNKLLPIFGLTAVAATTPFLTSCNNSKVTKIKWDVINEYNFKTWPIEYKIFNTSDDLLKSYFNELYDDYLIAAEDILYGLLVRMQDTHSYYDEDLEDICEIDLTINDVDTSDNRISLDFEYKTAYNRKPRKYHNILHFNNIKLTVNLLQESEEGHHALPCIMPNGYEDDTFEEKFIADDKWSLDIEKTTISKSISNTQYYKFNAEIAKEAIAQGLQDQIQPLWDRIIYVFDYETMYYFRAVTK